MTTDPDPPFGALLHSFRLAAGLTQEALAERAGLSVRGISNLERGARRQPYPHTVRQLARALRLSAADRARLEAALPRRAAAQPAPPAPAPPINLPAPPTSVVGRDRELAALRAALERMMAGRGTLALIGGEAGIGKTTLAEALCWEAAARGATVLVGRCYDLAETPPYGPWRELFARAPRDALPALSAAVLPLGDAGAAAESQAAIVARVRDYLAALAARQPLVLLLDDLQWGDPASVDLLRLLGRQIADVPLLILVAYRADEVARDHPLRAIVPLLVREARAERLDLRRLDDAAIGALVAAHHPLSEADHDRLVRYLAGRTEGNAFFLGEVLRTLEGEGTLCRAGDGWALGDLAGTPVPPLLREVIAGRVARLAPETGRLLGVAAVIGHAVPLALWAAVSGVGEDALLDHAEQAIEARLLAETPDGTGVRFAHALIRAALYDGTAAVRRRALHRRVGEALAATRTPDPDAVAYHLQRAGDPRAFAWLVRAGLRAHQAAAWLTAVERFAAAAALPDEMGARARARARGWLLFGSARLLFWSDNARALRLLDEAEPLALAGDDWPLATHIRFTRGQLLALRGAIRRGLATMEREVGALDALSGESRLGSGTHVALATIAALLTGGGHAASTPMGVPTAPTISPYRGALVTWLGHAGRYREALAMGEAFIAALAAVDDNDHPGIHTSVHLGLGQAQAALGHPAAARAAFARNLAGRYAENNAHMVGFTLWSELLLAVLPYQADDVAERTRLAAEAARAWERARGTITDTPYGVPTDLPLALLEGRWAAADRLARAMLTAATAGLAHGAIVALGVLARHRGDPDAAWVQVRQIHPAGPATEPGDCYFHHGIALQALAAELALDAGDLATAERWIAAHGRWLDWSGAVLWQAEQLLLRARHAQLSGDLEAARRHAEAALARAGEPRQPLALLAAHRLLGELATTGGDLPAAQTHLDESLALADACAAPYERALTLLALAEVRAAADRRADAAAALAEARALLVPLEAAPALAHAVALAARLASAPAPPGPALPFGLTPREAEVLALLAEGLTNPQIAACLFVGRSTVNTHLKAIYGKLGVSTRAAATRLALDQGLR